MSSLPKGKRKRKRKRNEKAFWYGALNNVAWISTYIWYCTGKGR